MKRKYMLTCLLAALMPVVAGCDLDLSNPNAPTDQQVLNTADGMKALTIGLQGRYGNSIGEFVFIGGLVSGELGNTNATPSHVREFQNFPDAGSNSQIEDTNPEILDLWTNNYATIKTANDILDNAGKAQLAPGTRSGMIALAKLMKAASIAALIECFEQIPVETATTAKPVFVKRATALQSALTLLQEAAAEIAATAPSTEFNNELLAPGFDLGASISALQARVSLLNGDYAKAISFADAVPGAASANLVYNTLDPNPLKVVFFELDYFRALSSFRSAAEPGDARIDALTTADVEAGFGGATLNGLNVFQNDADPFPMFTQSELTLIRAEANARQGNLSLALTQVNAIRTAAGLAGKTAAELDTQEKMLEEIFRQRSYALFLHGTHWGDLRRFGKLDQAKVAWLPYPFAERATNPNTPPNP